jgi:signal transduction histidine kinase
MQPIQQLAATKTARKRINAARRREKAATPAADRHRVETVVETLAALRGPGETLTEVAHDARNMVTALGLYCDLLEEPGVLAAPFAYYGHELRLVAAASRRLVEKIVAIDAQGVHANENGEAAMAPDSAPDSAPSSAELASPAGPVDFLPSSADPERRWDLLPPIPIANLAAEMLANRNLLAALAGPTVALTVTADGGARPVRLSGEDLTRILVNLVKNSAEAMPSGGRIHISLVEQPAARGAAACLALTVEDNGPGVAAGALETIFNSGYTTHGSSESASGNWTLSHRGLGLTITRSIVEGAGGRVSARNRVHGGAAFTIELPVRNTSY